jgi:hypothetical protein
VKVRYEVSEVYTPDNLRDWVRRWFSFESDSTDINELAHAAWRACHGDSVGPETEASIRRSIRRVIDDGQLEEFGPEYFEFVILGDNGDWVVMVESKP